MQELLQLFGPAAWLTILAAGYLTQPLVNVWKMTGVQSKYVPLTALMTGIVAVALLQAIQGLAFNTQGVAAVLVQGLMAGLGSIGLTEVHKKAEAGKATGQVEGPVESWTLNPYLPGAYAARLRDEMLARMERDLANLERVTAQQPTSTPSGPTVEVNVEAPAPATITPITQEGSPTVTTGTIQPEPTEGT